MIGSVFLGRGFALRFGLLTTLVGSVAAFLGWNAGETPLLPPPAIAATPWELTPADKTDPAADLTVLTQRRPWSPGILGRTAPGNPVAAAPTWRLAGIVQRDDETYALIASGAGAATKIDYLRVGDAVPDGRILLRITADSAIVKDEQRGTGQRVYQLFDRKP